MSTRGARPSRITWAALIARGRAAAIGLLWAISFGALRDFVWEDLRGGLIRLHGLSRAVRFQVVLGFVLLLGSVALLLFNDFLRVRFGLVAASIDIPGRGNLLPTVLLPVTLFLMAVAWSYTLAGALRVHPLLGSVPLLLYITTALGALISASDPNTRFLWLGWGAVAAVALMFVLPATRRLPVDVAFPLLLALVGVHYGLVQTQILVQDRVSGIGLGQINLEASVQSLQSLGLPLLLLLGMDIARFTQQAATWTALVVRRRLPDALVYVALVGVLGWLVYGQFVELRAAVADSGWRTALTGYAGGLGIPVGIALVWGVVAWTARRRTRRVPAPGRDPLTPGELGEHAEQAVLWVVMARMASVLLAFALFHVQGTVGPAAYLTAGQTQNVALILVALLNIAAGWIASLQDTWLWITAAGSLLVGLGLAWRRPQWRAAALYVAAYGVTQLWLLLTDSDGPLAVLEWQDTARVHLWLVLLVLAATLVWSVRRALTPARAGWLFFLLMVLVLLDQTDFIEDPFSPFFGFAGIGFVAFGIAWDALTAGSWANVETRALPRTGRIFLYIGYVLLTVTLINWALSTHNLDITGRYTGDAAILGLSALGKPLLYLFFPLVLALPADMEME